MFTFTDFIRLTACLVFSIIARFLCNDVYAGDQELLAKIRTSYQSEVLESIESKLDKLNSGTIAGLVPHFVELLDRREPTLDWRVLKLLSAADLSALKTSELAASLMRLLEDSEHATRALAIEVLVKPGVNSRELCMKSLQSSSPRVRAGCVEVLVRTGALNEQQAIELCRDSDPRVRGTAIQAIGTGLIGVQTLCGLLGDDESAVAYLAAERLGTLPDKFDQELVIRSLTQALTRPAVSMAAAQALARMGTDARSAMPALLRAYPTGSSRHYSTDDMAQVALSRIGSPLAEDIDEIIQIIDTADCFKRMIACSVLQRARTSAGAAAPVLVRCMHDDLALENTQMQKQKAGDYSYDEPYWASAMSALGTYWFVTEDVETFRRLAEEPQKISLPDSFWRDIKSRKTELIEDLLQSKNASVVNEVLSAIIRSDAPLPELELQLRALLRSKSPTIDQKVVAAAWLNTLTSDFPAVEDLLLRGLEEQAISLDQFGRHAGRLGLRSESSLQKLLLGTRTLKYYAATQCADSYLQLTDDRIEAFITLAKIPELKRFWLVNEVAMRQWSEVQLLPFARDASQSNDQLVKVAGIKVLANIGRPALEEIPSLVHWFEEELKKEGSPYSDLAIQCAIAVYKIKGDSAYSDRIIKLISSEQAKEPDNSRYYHYRLITLLGGLVGPESKYNEFVVEQLNACEPRVFPLSEDRDVFIAAQWMRMALRINDAAARDLVVHYSNSTDAQLSQIAKELLHDELP